LSDRPVTALLLGAGNRGRVYSRFALENPRRLRIVAIAEPNRERRELFAKRLGIRDEGRLFATWEDALKEQRMADAVINTTMDRIHHDSTITALRRGYHVLLEKPIAPTRSETLRIAREARRSARLVMICHTLRYHPLYSKIKELISSGRIGEIVHIESHEDIAYHHMATAFVRGRWRRREESNPILLSKCCHDIDLIAWFLDDKKPLRVSSFGGLFFFREERAPEGARERCLDGCRYLDTCPYSAPRLYVERGLWGHHMFYLGENDEEKMELLKTSQYGRCVFHCDNDVMDHQVVQIQFENGATATHSLTGLAATANRRIAIFGTDGEIRGDLERGKLVLKRFGSEKPVNVNLSPEGDEAVTHGHGGDAKLVSDFVEAVASGRQDVRTGITGSLAGHMIIYAADQSLRRGRVVRVR